MRLDFFAAHVDDDFLVDEGEPCLFGDIVRPGPGPKASQRKRTGRQADFTPGQVDRAFPREHVGAAWQRLWQDSDRLTAHGLFAPRRRSTAGFRSPRGRITAILHPWHTEANHDNPGILRT